MLSILEWLIKIGKGINPILQKLLIKRADHMIQIAFIIPIIINKKPCQTKIINSKHTLLCDHPERINKINGIFRGVSNSWHVFC